MLLLVGLGVSGKVTAVDTVPRFALDSRPFPEEFGAFSRLEAAPGSACLAARSASRSRPGTIPHEQFADQLGPGRRDEIPSRVVACSGLLGARIPSYWSHPRGAAQGGHAEAEAEEK